MEIHRILIVGYGSIGRRHLKIVRESFPKGEIRVLRHCFSKYEIELSDGVFHSIKDACDFKPQVAIVANPSPFHLRVASALISVGCHLLIEKPISNQINGIQELLNEAAAKGVVLQVGYNLRFLSSLCEFKKYLMQGVIGHLLSVRAEVGQHLSRWRLDTDYKNSVSAKSNLGGGVLLELSHELDYLRWIFGEVDWVSCWMGKISNLEIDVEDVAHILLGINRGPKNNPLICQLNMDFIRHDPVRICTAIGEFGTIQWDGLKGEIRKKDSIASNWKVINLNPLARDASYKLQWQDFISCVGNNRPPKVSGRDGLAVLNIVEAARLSSKNNGLLINISNDLREVP